MTGLLGNLVITRQKYLYKVNLGRLAWQAKIEINGFCTHIYNTHTAVFC